MMYLKKKVTVVQASLMPESCPLTPGFKKKIYNMSCDIFFVICLGALDGRVQHCYSSVEAELL